MNVLDKNAYRIRCPAGHFFRRAAGQTPAARPDYKFVCTHPHAEQHAQIISGPTNQEVLSGQVARFNCTLACGNQYLVTWYVTLPATMKTVLITPYTQLNQIKSIYGMEVSRGSTNECRSQSGGYLVEQIYVKALKQFHLMPVQCSTVCIAVGGDCGCGAAQLYFSKVALLSVAGI